MSLLDQLRDDDDFVRLWAARRAAEQGDAALVGTLLDLVLDDDTEVQVAGGMAEAHLHVGAAAAASKAVLSPHRTGELTRRFLADPSPVVRVEAIEGAQGVTLADLERMLTDPVPRVRCAGDPLGGLRAWLAAPDDDTGNRWVTELDWFGAGVVADCPHAAVAGDLRQALAAGVRAVEEGPLSPMLLHGPGTLRVGTHFRSPSPALQLRRPYPMTSGRRPQSAVVQVRCPGCGLPVRVEGTVEWVCHDDDRTAESEDGYAGVLDGRCPACGTPRRARVRLTLTRSRGDDSRELTWDAVEPAGGPHE